jgi:hypothetical protein
LIPETHSLGSRLGLPGFRFHSAQHQKAQARETGAENPFSLACASGFYESIVQFAIEARMLVVLPLAVVYDVRPDDRIVEVLLVSRVPTR